jgi:long-chain acyl-CoA synthetase
MSAAQYDKFETLLDCLDHWAATQPNKVYFTQPFSTEKTVDYTWGKVADQVNRMAAYLQSWPTSPFGGQGMCPFPCTPH